MLIYVTPVEDIDVGFRKSRLVEIEQSVPKDAKFLRMDLPGHPKPRKVRAETTNTSNIVYVINNTNIMVQLRTHRTFAVFEVADSVIESGTATFHASEVTFDDHIGTLNLTPLVIDALEDEDITFISDLRALTEEELLSIQGVGPVTLGMINEALAEYDRT